MTYPKDATRFKNLQVTGELEAATLKAASISATGVADITRPTAAGDSYSKAQLKTVVDAVDAILTLLGKATT